MQAEQQVVSKLKLLNCPLAETSVWNCEFAFGPEESRLDLIEWLIDIIDPNLRSIPVKGISVTSSPLEQRHQRLLIYLSTIGVCGDQDLQLIQGTCPLKKQAEFLLLLCDTAIFTKNLSNSDINAINNISQPTLEMSHYCSPSILANFFKVDYSIITSDLTRLLQQELNKPVPSLDQLSLVISKVQQSLDAQTNTLNSLEAQVQAFSWTEHETKAKQSLDSELKNLRDTLTTFSELYTKEFQIWTNKATMPELSALGITSHTIKQSLQGLLDLLGNIDKSFSLISQLTSPIANSIIKLAQEEKVKQSTSKLKSGYF